MTAADGESLLARLEAGLNSSERTVRADCFRQARAFIDRAAKAGGIDATYVRSFAVTADTAGRRVDVEIRAGKAFVP